MHLLLDTNGLVLKKRRNSFFLVSKTESRIISPLRVRTITISADCLVSASAVSLSIDHQIPLFYMNNTGRVYGKLYAKKFVSNELLRIRQTFFQWTPAAMHWITAMMSRKAQGQRRLIKDFSDPVVFKAFDREQGILIEKLQALNKNDGYLDIRGVMHIEARLGVNYWKEYFRLFPPQWKTGTRTARPASDPVNACINYFYGFNYGLVEHAIYLAGLNPYQGLMHQNQYNKPVLSFDLIEPFRPFTDRFVLGIFRDGIVQTHYFAVQDTSFHLNKKGKKVLIPLFFDYLDQEVKFMGERTSYRNHIYRYAQRLRKEIEKVDLDDLVDKL